MQLGALGRGERGRCGGPQQRVRERDAVRGDRQEAFGSGLLDRVHGVRPDHLTDQRDRWAAQRGGHGQRPPGLPTERGDPPGRHRLQAAGQRRGVLVEHPHARARHRAGDLQAVERVARRGPVHRAAQPERQRQTRGLGEQRVHLVGGERGQRHPVQAIAQRWRREPEGIRRQAGRAAGDQNADRLGRQPPYDVAQHPRRRRVDPPDVVDGDHQGPLRRQRADHAQHGDRDGVLAGLLVADRPGGPEQGDLEGAALHGGQRRRVLGRDVLEQVAQRDERQVGLDVDRGRCEHPVPARDRGGDGRAPDGGLADARVALDEQGGRARRDRVQERGRGGELVLAADGRPVRRTHP